MQMLAQIGTMLLPLLAADDEVFATGLLLRHLLAASVFAAVGVLILVLCIWMIDRLCPFSFRKEILEDQNTALAIIVGALLLGISLIIAAAIHG